MPLWRRNLPVLWLGTFTASIGMSLVIPFLPLYIEQLGVHDMNHVKQWTGMAFAATFILSAIVSPIWGRLADLKGRKMMLMRASLGMAIVTTMMGFAQNVYELVALRFLMGAVSGYIAAAVTLMATQAPAERSGYALGTLSTGQVLGTLLGPLLGGVLSDVLGLRHVFFVTGAFMFLAFLATWLFIREQFVRTEERSPLTGRKVWQAIAQPQVVWAMFITTFVLQAAVLSIEPIITVYVKQLVGNSPHIALISGVVVAASGSANALVASPLGRLSDRVGPRRILMGCLIFAACAIVPQAFVSNAWELTSLRFLLGISMAGLLPSINSLTRRLVPSSVAGRIFGYKQSAQYLGQIAGPLLGAEVAALTTLRHVFFLTSLILLVNAFWVYAKVRISDPGDQPVSQSPKVDL